MAQLYMILKIIFKILFSAVSDLASVGAGAQCVGNTGVGERAQGYGRYALQTVALPGLPLWWMV